MTQAVQLSVTYMKPQILLLDEPSNHLDLDAVQTLTQVCGNKLPVYPLGRSKPSDASD